MKRGDGTANLGSGSAAATTTLVSRPAGLISLALVIIVAAGLYLRTAGLDDPSLAWDETLHFFAAQSITEVGEPLLPSGERYGRGIWYTELVAWSFDTFGVSRSAARLPSVLFGALSVVLLFFVGRALFGTPVGLLAALMLALIPFGVVWSRECRMYVMLQFFYLAAIFAFFQALQVGLSKEVDAASFTRRRSIVSRIGDIGSSLRSRGTVLALFSFSCAYVAYQVHPVGGEFLPSVFVYLAGVVTLAHLKRGPASAVMTRHQAWLAVLTILGLALVATNPWVLDAIRFQVTEAPDSAYAPGGMFYWAFLRREWFFPVAACFVIGALQLCLDGGRPGFYVLTAIGIPLAHLSVARLTHARYMLHVYPVLLLVAAYGMCTLWSHFQEQSRRRFARSGLSASVQTNLMRASAALVLLVFLVPVLGWWRQSSRVRTRHDLSAYGGPPHRQWDSACRYVDQFWREGDVVIVTMPLTALHHCGRVDYALDIDSIPTSERTRLYSPGRADTPRSDDGYYREFNAGAPAITNEAEFHAVLQRHPRGWVIADRGRFARDDLVPSDVRESIVKELSWHQTPADASMQIYSWGPIRSESGGSDS